MYTTIGYSEYIKNFFKYFSSMETTMSFVVVASDNIRLSTAIPMTWLISKDVAVIGQNYKWHLPLKKH